MAREDSYAARCRSIKHMGDFALPVVGGTIWGSSTSGTGWISSSANFAPGDMLAIRITAASAGCAATDLIVGIPLGQP